MTTEAIVNGRVFDGERVLGATTVLVSDGLVTDLLPADAPLETDIVRHDLDGRWLAPGLIDLQVNGGGGRMFNHDPSVETIREIGAAHRRFGTTGFLPTLISDSPEVTARAITAAGEAIAQGVPGVLGIHVEGPFLDSAYRGIHDDRHFRPLTESDIERLSAFDSGRVLVTLAPEHQPPGLIRRLSEAGIVVFGGHSGATYEETRAALDEGMSGFTHLFNAMSPLGSRAPGMVGAALEDPGSWCTLIADGHHVHPASVAVAVAAKREGRMLLVTDGMATVGARGDSFEWNGETVTLVDGCLRLADGRLAGSNLDLADAVRNLARFTGMDRFQALRAASTAPAKALRLDDRLGYIRPGYRASMIELDDDFVVRRSWIDGAVDVGRD